MKINIAYTASVNWFEYARISAASVLKNSNVEDDYTIYFVSNIFNNEDIEYFKKLKKIRDFELKFITIDDNYFDGAIHDWLGVSASYRLRLPSLINEDKILYIDSDTLAMQDVAQIYKTDVSDYYLGAVEDCKSHVMRFRIKLTDEYLFYNSGMQLMNLKKLRSDNIEEKIMEKLHSNDFYTDQDVINDICKEKILSLPLKFNIMHTNMIIEPDLYTNRKDELDDAINSPVIYHFRYKPWQYPSNSIYCENWFEYQNFLNQL